MFFLFFIRLFKGYAEVSASRGYPERIINICFKNGISVWNLKRQGECITFCTDISGFRTLKRLRGKTGIKLHLLKRRGLPFFISRNKQRAGFVAGLAVFFLILNILTNFVWNINVAGNQNVSKQEILELCEKIGVHEGMKKSDVKSAEMRNKLLVETDKLSWVSFNVEGSRLTINVSEANAPDKTVKYPSNLVAKTDGIVKKIEIKSGNAAVTINTAVKKGDLLVSGTAELEGGITDFRHSDGRVIAQTERTLTVSTPYKITEKRKTGKVVKRSVFSFFGLDIPLFLGSVQGEYEKQIDVKRMEAWGGYVPITVTTATMSEVKQQEFTLSKKEAEERLLKQIEEKQKELLPVEIVDQKDTFTEKDGILTLKRQLVMLEDIAVEERLNFGS